MFVELILTNFLLHLYYRSSDCFFRLPKYHCIICIYRMCMNKIFQIINIKEHWPYFTNLQSIYRYSKFQINQLHSRDNTIAVCHIYLSRFIGICHIWRACEMICRLMWTYWSIFVLILYPFDEWRVKLMFIE